MIKTSQKRFLRLYLQVYISIKQISHYFSCFIATNKKNKDEINEKNKEENETTDHEKELLDEKERRKNEDKLINLALEWNYFDDILPILKKKNIKFLKVNLLTITSILMMTRCLRLIEKNVCFVLVRYLTTQKTI